MKNYFFLLALCFCAFTNKAMGQTWYIGYPTETDVTATFNNGTLTISGTGAMKDFEWVSDSVYNDSPWYSIRGNITNVVINSGVTSIGSVAISGCWNLTSVTIPNSVTSIGEHAFSFCWSLTPVTIPNSVTSIGRNAFLDCRSLTSINVDAANTQYSSVDGVLYNKNKTTLCTYPAGKQGHFTIPNSVTSIGIEAFSGCGGLTSVTIPNSVTNIEWNAFYNCSNLTSVTIPNSVTSIGWSVFSGCSGLTLITNRATTPQSINDNVFFDVNKTTCMLYVPVCAVSVYQSAAVWKDFANIVGRETCIITQAATNITHTSATLNKTVMAGTETITEQGFLYRKTGESTWSTSANGSLTDLTAATQYEFYAYATTASGTENGNTLNFTTQQNTYSVNATSNSTTMGTVSPSTKQLANGTTYTISEHFTYTAKTGYHFVKWTLNGSSRPITSFTINGATVDLVANFGEDTPNTYSVNATSNSTTMGTVSPSTKQLANGTYTISDHFSYTAKTGYHFVKWTLNGSNRAITSFTINGTTVDLVANFGEDTPNTYSVNATSNSTTMGTVSPSTKQLANGTYTISDHFSYTAKTGYHFVKWTLSGSSTAITSFTVNGATVNLVANFEEDTPNTYSVNATSNSITMGTVSPSTKQLANGTYTISEHFSYTAKTGYHFVKWTLNGSSTAITSFTVNGATVNLVANFEEDTPNTYSVNATSNSTTMGTVSPGTKQLANGTYTISDHFSYTAKTGYHFVKWTLSGSSTAITSFTVNGATVNLVANFEEDATTPSCLSNLIAQVWDDVLLVNNNPATNGGYTFVRYQWQKNGVNIAGETSGSLYFGNGDLDYNAEYSVLLTTTSEQQLQTCPVRLQTGNSGLRSYPNPTSGIVTIENANIQPGDNIEVFDVYGQLIQQSSADKNQTTLDLSPLPKGTYILKVNNKQVKIIKN